MAITNYTELKAVVADWLNRQDLTDRIPDFITLAGTRLQRDMARVKHPGAISQAIATVVDNYAPVPQDFIGVYQLMTQDARQIINYVSPDQSMTLLASSTAGSSNAIGGSDIYYTIIGKQFRLFEPETSNTNFNLELWYYAYLPQLSDTTATNWVLQRYPDLYLYGSLVHSASYLKSDERIPTWEGAYQKMLAEVELEADRSMRSQSKISSARRSF
jgi:hypothetical protein